MADEFVRIDVTQIKHIIEQLDELDDDVKLGIERTMIQSLDVYHQLLLKYTPSDSGTLRGSWTKEYHPAPTGMQGQVYTDMIYGFPVEYGRKSGQMPPVEPLYLWIERNVPGLTDKETQSFAWALAKSIAAGTSHFQTTGPSGKGGARMVEKSLELGKPYVDVLWDNFIAQTLQDF